MAAVIIRTYEPTDHDRVWALHREGVLDTRSHHGDPDPSYEEDLRNIERDYLSPGSHFWVAEANRRLVGMVAIQRVDGQTSRLRRMRVTGAWRRKGVATDLLLTAEDFCREQGYKRIILDTTEDQTAAHAMYEKNGFVRMGSRMIGVFPAFDYEKDLS
jgi:ribosomal protein S18 acetylase RimI-like enzyme